MPGTTTRVTLTRRTNMKLTSTSFVVATTVGGFLLLGSSGNGRIVQAVAPGLLAAQGAECSAATLQGDYLWTGRADRAPDAQETNFPRVFLGVMTFDGVGSVSATSTSSSGGVISRGVSAGSYTLESDCTGTMGFEGSGTHWDMVITTDGNEGQLIRTDDGTIATRSFKRR
jgi:hypothetical protein